MRSSWLASEPRSPTSTTRAAAWIKSLFVLLHHGGFQHENAARLVDSLGTAVGPEETLQLSAERILVAVRFLDQ